ncbi:MAG: Flp pilus assembly complex ATPase component TadA, partial [Bacteriovoracaceae bacterium]|nr:Flp pilus assembly complex ATPase component TadA [Bacteriovoracaceae bacterium]
KSIASEVTSLLKKRFVTKYRVIPIDKNQNRVVLATFDPTIKDKVDEFRKIFKRQVDIVVTTLSAWKKIFDTIEESVDELAESIVEVSPETIRKDIAQLASVEDIGEDIITFVNKILAEAYAKKASDIHLEPYENKFRIRLRIDGSLTEIFHPSLNMMLPVLSRIKIMAQMDIAEKRRPQDGRIKIFIAGNAIDYRVSSLPTLFGEKIVLRILDSSSLQLDMTKLGFESKQLEIFKEGIYRPFGMCLVTGPTGSGKTTTLYSALTELNKIYSNISTIENPVEFNLDGVNQVNVKEDIGLTFASALRTFLRQDPDIIMVGEIRDRETAQIAVEAALTGHLVLSTLHTNDAPSSIIRLLNMGIEPFLLLGSLNVVVAQRLCRVICKECKEHHPVSVQELVSCGFAPTTAEKVKVFKGRGCRACHQTGYHGRIAIYEVMPMSQKIRDLIVKNASAVDLKRQAIQEGMKTLRMSALSKVALGITTLEEALIISVSDHG